MIQGFYTKPTMDSATVELFKSIPSGRIHGRPTQVVEPWEQTQWESFKSVKDGPCVCFGVLRGTGNIIKECQKENIDFYYGDHSYLFNRAFKKEKSYRITKNDFQVRKIQELNEDELARVEKIKVEIKPWKKTRGEYILICPPSKYSTHYFLNDKDWLKETEATLMRHTDRPIKIRKKDSKLPLDKDIEKAYAVVTYNSTVAIHAVLAGVASFCNDISASSPVSSSDFTAIENRFFPEYRKEWLNTLLANQFTFEEMRNGYAWSKVNDKMS